MPKPKKKLFALLVAVDKYQRDVPIMPKCRFGPLDGCVNDAQDMLNYLEDEEGFDLDPIILENKKATKEAVVNAFETHLGQAKSGDVVLFYYSGHGIQEYIDSAIWTEESDGRLECLVCYNEENKPCLLADKELRYLLHRVAKGTAIAPKKESPHIVTIFDCCHSGENTRNGYMTNPEVKERQIKCIAPTRDWADFIFNKQVKQGTFKKAPLAEILPEATHLHLSACESDESALEVGGHGVFTTHLLKVLKRSGGDISYFDLMSQIKHYLRHSFEQKPQLLSSGEESTDVYDTFLGKPNSAKPLYGNVIYNEGKKSWIFDMGSLLGVTLKMRKIEVVDSKTKKVYFGKIKRIQLDETDLIFRGPDQPDKEKSYRGSVKGLMGLRIKVFVNNYNGISSKLTEIFDGMQAYAPNMVLEEDESLADYTLQVRDGYYYITKPKDIFRPLVLPVSFAASNAAKEVIYYLQHISHWAYVRRLRNPNTYLFGGNPILIEAFDGGQNGTKIDLSEDIANLTPKQNNAGQWKGKIALKLTNTTAKKLYVSALYLPIEFMVYLKGIDPLVYTLAPNESVWVFNWKKGGIGFSLDDIARDYNWNFTEDYIKIITSTIPFDTNRLAKKGLTRPMLKGEGVRENNRSGLNLDEDERETVGDDWTTQSITLRFHNPMYNKLFVKDIAAMLRGEMARYAIGLYTNFSIENDQQILQLKPDIELISVDNTPAAVSKKMVNRLFCEEEKNLRNNSFSTFRAIHSNQSPILTVGDLWLHDNETRSLSAHFMGQFPVFQISGNLINAFESDSLRKTRRYTKAKQLIISNGLSELLNQTISSETIRIKKIIEQQQIVLSKITIQHPNIKIWIHGYDYFASNVKKYGKLIDEYNEQLAEMTSTLEMVSYIDLRGSLHQGQWESDYLPNNDGFEVLAGRFFAKLLN